MNRAGVHFLKIDLETALTFLDIARRTQDKGRQERNRRAARRAYDTIVKFMARVKLGDEESHTLVVGLEQLKCALEKSGEAF